MGLMQITRATASDYGVKDPFNVRENIQGGVRYLHVLLNRHKSIRLALASYNAGPKAVQKYRGIPPYRETRQYVKRVLRVYRRLQRKARASGKQAEGL